MTGDNNRYRKLAPEAQWVVDAGADLDRLGRELRAFIDRLNALAARPLVRKALETRMREATTSGRSLWDSLSKARQELALLERAARNADRREGLH